MPVSDFFSAKIKSTFTEHTTTFTEYTKNKLSYEYVKITQLRMKCEGCNRDIYWASGGGEWKKKSCNDIIIYFSSKFNLLQ